MGFQIPLEPALVKLRIVKRGQACRQTTESADESKVSDDDISDETKLGFSREFEPSLGLALHFAQRIAGTEKHGNQAIARKDGVL